MTYTNLTCSQCGQRVGHGEHNAMRCANVQMLAKDIREAERALAIVQARYSGLTTDGRYTTAHDPDVREAHSRLRLVKDRLAFLRGDMLATVRVRQARYEA